MDDLEFYATYHKIALIATLATTVDLGAFAAQIDSGAAPRPLLTPTGSLAGLLSLRDMRRIALDMQPLRSTACRMLVEAWRERATCGWAENRPEGQVLEGVEPETAP